MKKINWGETLIVATIEGILVLIGVLLGFYFQNIKDENDKRDLLVRDLNLLSLELTENKTLNSNAADLVDQLKTQIDSSLLKLDKLPSDTIISLDIPNVHWYGNTEPRPYSLDMMINNGSFSLIRDNELKIQLMLEYPDVRNSMLQIDERDKNLDYWKKEFRSRNDLLEYKRDLLNRTRERCDALGLYMRQVSKIDSLITLEISLNK